MTNTREERVALRDCPFCGDSARVDRDLDYVAVLCTNCNARTSMFRDDTLRDDSKAIAAWNERVEPSPDVWEAVERAFREGWRLGHIDGEAGGKGRLSDETDAWEMSRAREKIPDPPKVTVEEDRA